MDEIQVVDKFYTYDYDKPDLSEEFLAHFGVKGMRWGHRKDRLKGSCKTRKRKSSTKSKVKRAKKQQPTKEELIEKKDLKEISKRKNEFTTKELNEVMNRINAEERLDKMYKDSKPTTKAKNTVKKILNDKKFKVAVAVIAVSALVGVSYAAYRKNEGMTAPIKRIEDKQNPYKKQYRKDVAYGAGQFVRNYAAESAKEKAKKIYKSAKIK